jgi:putative DeoR family transcriptional regulator, stage III sporulation protein D
MRFRATKSKEAIKEALLYANYILENKVTIRQTAKHFGLENNSSRVSRYIKDVLPEYDEVLYNEVKEVLDGNKKNGQQRGGESTKQKFENKVI